MSKLIFRLNGVGDDEAEEVRSLLDTHNIDYYETDAGRWGISVAALWLADESQLLEVKRLLADYQQQRALRIKTAREQDPNYQPPLSFTERFAQAPLYYSLLVAAIVAVIALSIYPFLSLH